MVELEDTGATIVDDRIHDAFRYDRVDLCLGQFAELRRDEGIELVLNAMEAEGENLLRGAEQFVATK